MKYRRASTPGATYFFTVNLNNRNSQLLIEQIELLRQVVRHAKRKHPFEIIASVIMPDHLHMIWKLPEGDMDYSKRWSLIKSNFSRQLPAFEFQNRSRKLNRERGIWQRRFWEHQIRDERDLNAHINYIHFNPVKHGYVSQASQWPYSSIHKFIRQGVLPMDWGLASHERDDVELRSSASTYDD